MKISPISINNLVKFRNIQTPKFSFKGLNEPEKDTFEKNIETSQEAQSKNTVSWDVIRKSTDEIIKNQNDTQAEIEKIEECANVAKENAQAAINEYKILLKQKNGANSNSEDGITVVKSNDFTMLTKYAGEFTIGQIFLHETKDDSYLLIDYENGIKIKAIGNEIVQYYEGYNDTSKGYEHWANRIAFKDGKVHRITQDGAFETFEDNIITAKKELVLVQDPNGKLEASEYYGKNSTYVPSWNKIKPISFGKSPKHDSETVAQITTTGKEIFQEAEDIYKKYTQEGQALFEKYKNQDPTIRFKTQVIKEYDEDAFGKIGRKISITGHDLTCEDFKNKILYTLHNGKLKSFCKGYNEISDKDYDIEKEYMFFDGKLWLFKEGVEFRSGKSSKVNTEYNFTSDGTGKIEKYCKNYIEKDGKVKFDTIMQLSPTGEYEVISPKKKFGGIFGF